MAEFNGKEMTPELIQKAMECTSAEELRAQAEENGIAITAEEAEAYLEELSGQELSLEQLEQLAAGVEHCYAVGGCVFKCRTAG